MHVTEVHGSQTSLGKSEEVIIKPECLLQAAALAERKRERAHPSG